MSRSSPHVSAIDIVATEFYGVDMLYNCYLKKGTVYIPTVVNQGTAVYMDTEPVTIAPVADTEALRRALRNTIPEENAFVAPSVEDARKPFVLLKYTGDKSWSAFKRSASTWSIYHKNGTYQIGGYRTHQKGYWERDAEQIIKFPPGTLVDDVIDRLIGILQDAAR
jgi:hypothetical protein